MNCLNCKFYSKAVKGCYNIKEGIEPIPHPLTTKCDRFKESPFSDFKQSPLCIMYKRIYKQ